MVLHCLCFFMSLILTYFFIIIGLLFHFCPCMMFSAKQSDGTHVSSFKKMKSLQDSSANFSCPAFYDALSSLSLFHSKNVTKNCSWKHTSQQHACNKDKSCPLNFVSWGIMATEYTFGIFYTSISHFINNLFKPNKPIFCILRWVWSVDTQSTATFIIYFR